jgi:hypothetical protein
MLAFHRPHLLEQRRSRWSADSADDHVADLAFGVAANDRDQAARSHDLCSPAIMGSVRAAVSSPRFTA